MVTILQTALKNFVLRKYSQKFFSKPTQELKIKKNRYLSDIIKKYVFISKYFRLILKKLDF